MANINVNALVSDIRTKLAAAAEKLTKLTQPAAFKAVYDSVSRDFAATSSMLIETQEALTVAMAMFPAPSDLPLRVQIASETTATLVRQLQSQQASLADLNSQMDAALGQKSGLGIPSWMLYVGGAVVALVAFLGLRKKK